MDSLTELFGLIDDFLPHVRAGMETPSVGERGETALTEYFYESSQWQL